MIDAVLIVVAILLWVMIGLLAANLALVRRGYRSGFWYVIGAVLGPIFVPIAIERSSGKRTVFVEREPGRSDSARGKNRLTVLVALDGDDSGDRAMIGSVELLEGLLARLILVTVLDHDAMNTDQAQARAAARAMLVVRAAQLPDHIPEPSLEIAAGAPVTAIVDVADAHDADLIVIGAPKLDMATRLRGSVAAGLVKRSGRPVWVGPQQHTAPRPTADT